MKLEKLKLDKKQNKVIFMLKGTDEVFANTIRRLVIEEVPTLAVEDLEIKDNNSALFDEMLGLRLGLLPIITDLKSYVMKDHCKCSGAGCAQCELKINLKSSKKGYVYAEEAQSSDPKCTFAQDKMIIVKLLAKQKIDVTMTAVLGQGKTHVKWSPGLVFYKQEPQIKIGKVADPEKIVKMCPKNVFNTKNNKLEINKDKLYDCHLCQQCVDLDNNITLEKNDNYIFNLESWGQLTHKEMLTKASDILTEKVVEMEKLI